MNVQVITLFPEMFAALASSIPGRAQKKGLLQLSCLNPRDFLTDHHSVDDKPYGGGPGMVMKFQPLQAAIQQARQRSQALDAAAPLLVSYLSPQGRCFDQTAAQQLSKRTSLILLAGRYEGIDERLIGQEVDEEWSIGNFVLSGGELAAMCMIDAVVRLLDGALGHPESAVQDSFTQLLLDHPHYTRPCIVADQAVPDVLLSGNHDAIARWRLKQSLGRTWQRRPDLLEKYVLSEWERVLLAEFIHEHSEESGGHSE